MEQSLLFVYSGYNETVPQTSISGKLITIDIETGLSFINKMDYAINKPYGIIYTERTPTHIIRRALYSNRKEKIE